MNKALVAVITALTFNTAVATTEENSEVVKVVPQPEVHNQVTIEMVETTEEEMDPSAFDRIMKALEQAKKAFQEKYHEVMEDKETPDE